MLEIFIGMEMRKFTDQAVQEKKGGTLIMSLNRMQRLNYFSTQSLKTTKYKLGFVE